MFDATSGDAYEIARTQGGGDPILLPNQCLAIKMRDEFFILHNLVDDDPGYVGVAGDYLVVNNQKAKRMACPCDLFELLFEVRQ